MARRVLPSTTVGLPHVEPDLRRLRVNVRRHIMFWSGGLANYEPASVRLLKAAIEPGDVVLDVGANIGFFSTLFSRWVGEAGRVISIEPEPENLTLLRRNVDDNLCHNVTICVCAVGASRGIAHFSVDEATGSTGHLGETPTAGESAVGTGKVRIIPIDVETLDDLVADYSVKPNVIKMDIEGGEAQALEGASRTIAECRPVVVSEVTGDGGPKVLAWLAWNGYRLWDLESGQSVTPDGQPFMIVAIPEEAIDGARARRIIEVLGETKVG
jgi:FkbM family methyltransferase